MRAGYRYLCVMTSFPVITLLPYALQKFKLGCHIYICIAMVMIKGAPYAWANRMSKGCTAVS